MSRIFATIKTNFNNYYSNYINSKYQDYYIIFETGDFEIRLLEEIPEDNFKLLKERVEYHINNTPFSFGRKLINNYNY